MLSEDLGKYPDIEVVGTAVDPYVARDKILKLKPDVMTLDLEMPRMDGLSFLARLMKHYPLPVVVVSSVAPENSQTAIKALELGATEVISKPGSAYSTPDVSKRLIRAIRCAASAHPAPLPVEEDKNATAAPVSTHLTTTGRILAIGASTGGTQAIQAVLTQMPSNSPGTVVVQHMPEHFTAAFAARLDSLCKMQVKEAKDGDIVTTGVALIAPGGMHMVLDRNGALYVVRIKDGPAVHHQKPAVDVLFQSVARSASHNAIGVLLTGMGADGAKGLLAMRESGAFTIAQDEKTSVVYGMPKEAVKMGAVEKVMPLPHIAGCVLSHCQE